MKTPERFKKSGNFFLPELGIIGNFFYIIFFLLKFLPPQCFIEERVKHQIRLSKIMDHNDRKKQSKKRLIKTELLVISYLIIYVVIIIFNQAVKSNLYLFIAALILITLRIVDVIQVNVNIIIFDPLRLQKASLHGFVYSFGRTIILVLYNFFEIIILFGLYYMLISDSFLHNNLPGHLSVFDKFYFSTITQFTIGYGDITPIGFGRVLACIQAAISFFFSLFILSKIISAIPNVAAINNQNVKSDNENFNL